MSGFGRTMVLVVAAMVSAVACTTCGSGAGACAYQVQYHGRTYLGVTKVEFTVGEKLGDATVPPCNDTGCQRTDRGSERTVAAYEVDGVSPRVAIAVGDTRSEARFMAARSGRSFPPEVEKLIDDAERQASPSG